MELCLSWEGFGCHAWLPMSARPPASNGHFWSPHSSGLFADQRASVVKTAGLLFAAISEYTPSPGHNGVAKSNNCGLLGKQA